MMDNTKFSLYEMTLWSKVTGMAIALLIITLNALEIYILLRTRRKAFHEKMLLSLTFCDLASGICGPVAIVFVSFDKNEFHQLLFWNVWEFSLVYSTLVSLLHLVCISIDRWWAVAAPLRHIQQSPQRKLVVTLFLPGFFQ